MGIVEQCYEWHEHNPITKAVAQIVPFGAAAEAAVGALVAKARRERLTAFIRELQQQGVHQLRVDWTKDEYLFAIVRTVEAAVQAARVEKVRYFSRILRNYLAGVSPKDIDAFEEILSLVNEMSIRELQALMILRQHEQHAGLKAEPHPGPWKDEQWQELVKDVGSRLGVEPGEVPGLFSRLTRTGLCVPVTGSYLGYEGGQYRSTRSLYAFLDALRTVPDLDEQS